jgi:hypothetical protein
MDNHQTEQKTSGSVMSTLTVKVAITSTNNYTKENRKTSPLSQIMQNTQLSDQRFFNHFYQTTFQCTAQDNRIILLCSVRDADHNCHDVFPVLPKEKLWPGYEKNRIDPPPPSFPAFFVSCTCATGDITFYSKLLMLTKIYMYR